jgi:hypothetical protein
MARTEFEIEITGLKIRYRGDREDVRRITGAIQNQFGDILSTPAILSDGRTNGHVVDGHIAASPEQKLAEGKKDRRRSNGNRRPAEKGRTSNGQTRAIAWSHDPSKWGNPKQEWNPTKKSLWLLYVVENAADIKDLTASEIAKTFNQHCRESGAITGSNVSRDLKGAKLKQPALVQNDTSKEPPPWYLTSAGKTEAEKLVAEARGLSS